MKLKLDDQGHAVLKDGNPVYVHADGKEHSFDAPGTVATITRLNGEAKSHRERAEKAEGSLKTFEGIADPTAALAALETVSKIKDKRLLEAGEVDRVRSEAIKAVEDKYAPVTKERDELKTMLVGEKIGGGFARSKFIADKVAIPADMVQARFGHHFKLEGNAVVAYDAAGNKIFSKTRAGEAADVDEALEILIDGYAYKDSILKGSGASGGGSNGAGGANGSKRIVRRSEFEGLDPAAQAATAKAASAGTVSIID